MTRFFRPACEDSGEIRCGKRWADHRPESPLLLARRGRTGGVRRGPSLAAGHPRSGAARAALLAAVLACAARSDLGPAGRASADDSVVYSKHDLSMWGPGPVRAINESEVCIFCHAPHNASPQAPLWNRHNPRSFYRIYSSSTIDARIDQPGPASKMCLSCHDGTIALGMVLGQSSPIPMTHPVLPSGPSNLTTDLSDDHPIGFRYDRQLANRDPQLRSPDLIDRRIKLGRRGEVECVACHDPHNNELGNFLVLPTRGGVLCNSCHQMDGWHTSSHATSPKGVPQSLSLAGEPFEFRSLADNACASCHVSHGAVENEWLLRARASDLCLSCHDGLTSTDILAVMGQRSGHHVNRWFNRHDPAEDPRTMPVHVDCVDCHNPHAVAGNPVANLSALSRISQPAVPPGMRQVPGVTIGGAQTERTQYYHEVCFRCHGDQPVPLRGRIVRDRDDYGNIRRQFTLTAASAHPVAIGSRLSAEVPSLLPAVRSAPIMTCQDCHNNPDARQLGGGGANGPHGSRFPFLLADRYDTADFTIESPQAFALCYRCHDRASILGDESFSLHSEHILRGRTPCSACHSPHGVSGSSTEHSHLINFDVSIVGGERQFIDTGRQSGSCTLTCHGVRHVNFNYSR